MPDSPQNDTETTEKVSKQGQGGGQPTKYRAIYAKQAALMFANGSTEQEVADAFEVTVKTIQRWKAQHPKFCLAVKVGKEPADDRVELALFQQAIDPTQPALAKIFWLKNRRRKHWTDERKVTANLTLEQLITGEFEGDDEGEDGEAESGS